MWAGLAAGSRSKPIKTHIMNNFTERFAAYYDALTDAKKVNIYNVFAEEKSEPHVLPMSCFDSAFAHLTPWELAQRIRNNYFDALDGWFYIDAMSWPRSITDLTGWLGIYVPDMASFFAGNPSLLLNEDADAERLIVAQGAEERLNQMSLDDCIAMWNSCLDQFHQLSKMQPMENENWWNHLAKELGAWDLMHFVWNSGDDFNETDKYFAYVEDGCTFFSFSTKQELMEYMKEFFIDEITNRQ